MDDDSPKQFVHFLPNAEHLAAREAQMRRNFSRSGKLGTFEAHAIDVIARRLAKAPTRYVEFGPYWWAVKSILMGDGYEFGQLGEPIVQATYRADSDIRTLIAAEEFAEYHRRTFFVGTNVFLLGEDGAEAYELEDFDMIVRELLVKPSGSPAQC
ncbi:MAG: hypothetical protein KIT17_00665 [Rubrivivax sp.]|nr:hypothetical protein [Rubrivivax sp.]